MTVLLLAVAFASPGIHCRVMFHQRMHNRTIVAWTGKGCIHDDRKSNLSD